jgi:outer membrane murein-binding lipoprotein Lpp
MAAIKAIEFGKNLRPTTVEAVTKINELIAAVNQFSSAGIDALRTDVNNLKSTVATHTSQIGTANDSIDKLKKTASAHTTDIDKIKITLYTPLADGEVTE